MSLRPLLQAFQLPAPVWRPAESDTEMLQGERRKDSGLLRHRLRLHAVCEQRQAGATLTLKLYSTPTLPTCWWNLNLVSLLCPQDKLNSRA